MNDRYLVLTPEKVVVEYRYAGLGARIGAHLFDLFIVAAIYYITMCMTSLIMFVDIGLYSLAVSLLLTFGIFIYFICLEAMWQGQTIGKKLARIRVLNVDGTPLGWRGSFVRNILRAGDFLPMLYGVGFTTMFLNQRSQRLGDLIGGTVVVQTMMTPTGFTPAPHRAGIHPLEYSIGELGTMSLDEYQAIKRLTDRFPLLPPDEQRRSISHIWEPFRERHGISPVPNVHPIYQMEAVIMKFGRLKKLV